MSDELCEPPPHKKPNGNGIHHRSTCIQKSSKMYLLSSGWGGQIPAQKIIWLLYRGPRIFANSHFPWLYILPISLKMYHRVCMHSRICILGSCILAIHISPLRLGCNVQRTGPGQLLHQQTCCLVRGGYLKMEANCFSECYFGGFKRMDVTHCDIAGWKV